MLRFLDCVVVPFIEVETSEGEAGAWGWDVIGSVWDGEFQLEFGIISERIGRATREGVLCARGQKFLLSHHSHIAMSTSVLHRKWVVFTFASLTIAAWTDLVIPLSR